MKEFNNNTLAIIFCPPKSRFPEKPEDISRCELINCPSCNELMWYSEKKKEYKKKCEKLKYEIIFECHICFEKIIVKNTWIMKNHIKIDL